MYLMIELGPELQKTADAMNHAGRQILPVIRDGLEQGAKETAERIAVQKLTGNYLKVRTGNLRRSVSGWMEGDLEAVVGIQDASAVREYAWLLGDNPENQPMTIRPKKGRYLTIPVGEALTPAGVLKGEYSGGLRSIDGGFFFSSKRGNLMFGIRKGKTTRSRVRPLFVLVRQVEVSDTGAIVDQVIEDLDSGTFLEPLNRLIEDVLT